MTGFAKYHDELIALFSMHKGQEFTAGQIKDMFEKKYPGLRSDFVHPSDHCIDHVCKEACSCATTDKAILCDLRGIRTLLGESINPIVIH